MNQPFFQMQPKTRAQAVALENALVKAMRRQAEIDAEKEIEKQEYKVSEKGRIAMKRAAAFRGDEQSKITRRRIMRCIRSRKEVSTAGLMDALKMSKSGVQAQLRMLILDKRIERFQTGRCVKYRIACDKQDHEG